MLRTAAHDPLCAFVFVVTGPFRAGRNMLQMSAAFSLVVFVFGFALQYLRPSVGIAKGDFISAAVNWLYPQAPL